MTKWCGECIQLSQHQDQLISSWNAILCSAIRIAVWQAKLWLNPNCWQRLFEIIECKLQLYCLAFESIRIDWVGLSVPVSGFIDVAAEMLQLIVSNKLLQFPISFNWWNSRHKNFTSFPISQEEKRAPIHSSQILELDILHLSIRFICPSNFISCANCSQLLPYVGEFSIV